MSLDADSLIRSQVDLQGRIARNYENLKKGGAAKITPGAVASRLQMLESNWNKFVQNHEDLTSTHWKSVSEHDYVKRDYYGQVEETFVSQRAVLLDLQQSLKTAAERAAPKETEVVDHRQRRSLPRIQIPTFSGKYEEWPAFRDLFQSLVTKDPSLSGVEQLHYLRTNVKGEAEQLIRNLPTTEENFARAWTMLTGHATTRISAFW